MSTIILDSVKRLLSVMSDYHEYDDEIVMWTNMALNTLTQMGVGPKAGFQITASGNETLEDFVSGGPLDNQIMHNSVINYLALRVKVNWDPPQNSYVMEQYKQQIEELGWRLNAQVDPITTFA